MDAKARVIPSGITRNAQVSASRTPVLRLACGNLLLERRFRSILVGAECRAWRHIAPAEGIRGGKEYAVSPSHPTPTEQGLTPAGAERVSAL
jgi:hypothetical protein